MLDNSRGRWFGIDSWAGQPLYSLSGPLEEGMGLCAIMENGKQSAFAQPTVTANDKFIGVCYSWNTTPTQLIAYETYTVPAGGGSVTVKNAPANGVGLRVLDTTSGNAVNTGAAGAAGAYQQGGTNNQTFTFDSTLAGHAMAFTYAYAPTVAQAQALVGNGWLGEQPSTVTGTIGLIRRGLIYTNNFDPSADYSAPNVVIKLANNGVFTVGGNGPVVPADVYEMPSADYPYLGLNIDAR